MVVVVGVASAAMVAQRALPTGRLAPGGGGGGRRRASGGGNANDEGGAAKLNAKSTTRVPRKQRRHGRWCVPDNDKRCGGQAGETGGKSSLLSGPRAVKPAARVAGARLLWHAACVRATSIDPSTRHQMPRHQMPRDQMPAIKCPTSKMPHKQTKTVAVDWYAAADAWRRRKTADGAGHGAAHGPGHGAGHGHAAGDDAGRGEESNEVGQWSRGTTPPADARQRTTVVGVW